MKCNSCNKTIGNVKYCPHCGAINEDFENQGQREENEHGKMPENGNVQNYEREHTSHDGLWNFLEKIHIGTRPTVDRLIGMGTGGILLIILVLAALQNSFFVISFSFVGSMGRNLILFLVILSAITLLISFFINKFLFKLAANAYGIRVMPQLLNVSILLSMIPGILIRMVINKGIITNILVAIVNTGFLLAIVKRNLAQENYQGVGIRYMLYNLIFNVLIGFAIMALLMSIAAYSYVYFMQ